MTYEQQLSADCALVENYFNNKMSNGNGLSRMVQPFEVVDMVDFLISDRATAVSGQVFNVCGVREVR